MRRALGRKLTSRVDDRDFSFSDFMSVPMPDIGVTFAESAGEPMPSPAELADRLSGQRVGAGNPSFKHGRRMGVNIPGWKLNLKDETCCRNCGSNDRVELHHAIPRSKFVENIDA